jgi:hypothetical protein
MPKKSATARNTAQRSKSKAQKSFELVRPVTQEPESEPEAMNIAELAEVSASALSTPAPALSTSPTPAAKTTKAKESVPDETRPVEEKGEVGANSGSQPRGSASARLAARRQAAQKNPQRSSASLITSEHYAYVRKDLILIAVLAVILFSIIIILHFVPGIGA